MKKARPTLVFLLKFLVSAGLLAFFLTRIDLEGFFHTLASADFALIAVALGVYLLTQALSSVRWMLLSRPLGFETSFKNLIVYYFIGMFFNLFAPSTVGGDVTRVYYLARDSAKVRESPWSRTAANALISVFTDRAIGMLVLIWLGAAGLVLYPAYAVPRPLQLLTFALALGFVAAWLLLPLLRRLLPENGHPALSRLRLALRSYRMNWKVLPMAMAVSLLVHLVQAWMHVLLGRALFVEIPWSYALILYPLVGTFAALPVSLNGIGLREGGYLFMLGLIGINSEKAVAFGLLWFMIIAVDSLVGGVAFVLKRSPKPSTMASEIELG